MGSRTGRRSPGTDCRAGSSRPGACSAGAATRSARWPGAPLRRCCLHSAGDFETAAADVAAAVEQARADPRVDPGRLALWFFSGGGLLLADWLRDPPGWLRCVAATYPVLAA